MANCDQWLMLYLQKKSYRIEFLPEFLARKLWQKLIVLRGVSSNWLMQLPVNSHHYLFVQEFLPIKRYESGEDANNAEDALECPEIPLVHPGNFVAAEKQIKE